MTLNVFEQLQELAKRLQRFSSPFSLANLVVQGWTIALVFHCGTLSQAAFKLAVASGVNPRVECRGSLCLPCIQLGALLL